MHHDDWTGLHGAPEVNQAARQFAARMRPRAPATSADVFTVSLLMGVVGVSLTTGVQGLIPVPRRGRPIQWYLQEVVGNQGDVMLTLEYGPYLAPDRLYTVFAGYNGVTPLPPDTPAVPVEAFNTDGAPFLAKADDGSFPSSARGPATFGDPLPGWPAMFETGSVIRVTTTGTDGVSAPTGVQWLLFWIDMAALPGPLGYSGAS